MVDHAVRRISNEPKNHKGLVQLRIMVDTSQYIKNIMQPSEEFLVKYFSVKNFGMLGVYGN